MTDYTAFVTKWNTLSGATASKLSQINAATQPQAQPAIISANKIVNAIVPADLTAIVTTAGTTGTNQLLAVIFALSGGNVDASAGTTTRLIFQTIFAGKTQTLANLGALVAPYDNATIPWWQANGYPRAFDMGDVTAAGVS